MRNLNVSKEHKINLLEEFYNEFGREPKATEEYKGVKLGIFLTSIRTGHTKILEKDKNYLSRVGLRLTKGVKQELVHEKVLLLGEFYNEFKREPKATEEYNGARLGNFLSSIKRGDTKLSYEDTCYLKCLGISLLSQNKKKLVHEKVLLLGEFYNKFKREPNPKEMYKDVKLGIFLGNIRKGGTKISKEDMDHLEKVGIRVTQGIRTEMIHKKNILLAEFYNEFKREPKWSEEYKGVKLGNFLGNVRRGDTKISKEDREYLESLGVNLVSKNKQK